jgi:hypothetical protein
MAVEITTVSDAQATAIRNALNIPEAINGTDGADGAAGADGVDATNLELVAGTDAAVTMVANRHYELAGASLSATRTYKLPAGAVGDRVRVSLTTGAAVYALIIQGDTGITINGGSAATEWSRLFIAREYVEFRATSTSNWDVWGDGRVEEYCRIFGVATTAYAAATNAKFTMGGSDDPYGLAGVNEIKPRRTGKYDILLTNRFRITGGSQRVLVADIAASGAGSLVGTYLENLATAGENESLNLIRHSVDFADLTKAVIPWYYTDSVTGTNEYFISAATRPELTVRRIL